ncbi:MAG TPA: class I SAM-dependent methyltransferase [Phycisphaerales bacterium]|nr:class I SAM-dependent methyltransferase [Phycisphaerales bacterium]
MPETATTHVPEFGYSSAAGLCTAPYLGPAIHALLPPPGTHPRVLDVGCGNGYWCGRLLERGYRCVGVDTSDEGIAIARRSHPGARFERLAAERDVLERLGEDPFDVVLSTEVVEHLYDPRAWAAACFASLRPGGRLICSTPYHGYLKNVMLAATNHWDRHHDPMWDGGHIKFWSRRTLANLLAEAGFVNIRFRGAGRLPWLWKSMVLAGDTP